MRDCQGWGGADEGTKDTSHHERNQPSPEESAITRGISHHQRHQPSPEESAIIGDISHQPTERSATIRHQPAASSAICPHSTNHQPPTTYHQPPTINHQPPTITRALSQRESSRPSVTTSLHRYRVRFRWYKQVRVQGAGGTG